MRVLLGVFPTYQWCLVLATAPFLVSGCGSKGLKEPLPSAPARVRVEAPWKDGGTIPRRYTCDGGDVNPEPGASAPPGTSDVAFVMTDPDAPGGTFVHWTHWGERGEGRNSFGKTGYSGPCPPKGDKPHRYVITAYALRRPLRLASGSSPDAVLAAIRGSAFASGRITGLYGR